MLEEIDRIEELEQLNALQKAGLMSQSAEEVIDTSGEVEIAPRPPKRFWVIELWTDLLNKVLAGLRSIANLDLSVTFGDDEASKIYQRGFEKGLDVASAEIFKQVAVVLAEEQLLAYPGNYPLDNPELTLQKLIQLEQDWLFKHELDLSQNT